MRQRDSLQSNPLTDRSKQHPAPWRGCPSSFADEHKQKTRLGDCTTHRLHAVHQNRCTFPAVVLLAACGQQNFGWQHPAAPVRRPAAEHLSCSSCPCHVVLAAYSMCRLQSAKRGSWYTSTLKPLSCSSRTKCLTRPRMSCTCALTCWICAGHQSTAHARLDTRFQPARDCCSLMQS